MLKVENLHYRRGNRTLFAGLNFSVREGEALYIIGVNGSGKSTLLKLIGGLMSFDLGRISWHERSILSIADSYRSQYLWLGEQGHGFRPELTVEENTRYQHAMLGACPPDLDDEIWDRLGLFARRDMFYSQLSTGERQRLALIPLWTVERSLWILDEPTSSLDDQTSRLIDERIDDHAARGGVCVCATHRYPARTFDQARFLQLIPAVYETQVRAYTSPATGSERP